MLLKILMCIDTYDIMYTDISKFYSNVDYVMIFHR